MNAMTEVDVAIVGGGIAGASLATALARAGLSVRVLEATERFTDRVRGESMMPWGVAEAVQLGVAEHLLAAGAHVAPLWKRYSENQQEPRDIPVGMLVPGVAGSVNLHHPVACQALLDAAAAAGADVRRGVGGLTLQLGGPGPLLDYLEGGVAVRCRASLIVGADGRASATRRAAGIELQHEPAVSFVAGLLLDGVGGDDGHDVVVEHDLGMGLVLHQGGGRARAYHVVPSALRTRYGGSAGAARFLADLARSTPALGEPLARARPAGPCAAFPGDDSWTSTPFGDGVVLIGDAAGHNDPVAGCGLSIAMRDARIVRDLIVAGARTAADFAPYGAERTERLRRLRIIADLLVDSVVLPGPDRSARRRHLTDAMASFSTPIFPVVVGMFAGPETIPESAIAQIDQPLLAPS